MRYLALGLLMFSSLARAEVPQSQHVWIITERESRSPVTTTPRDVSPLIMLPGT
jgi:hypothetical protein